MADKSEFVTVTNDNVADFNWTVQTSVNLFKCLKEIPQDSLKACRTSLVQVKFENMTTINNILVLLTHCPNLKKMTFMDVLIDEFRRAKVDKMIEHPNVTHVVIKSATSISKKEHWLIDFLNRTVTFKKLRSLRVQKVFTDDFQPELTFDFVERYGQEVENTIVTRFISRHRATLKELEIGGPGLKVSETDPKEGDKIKSVQLDSFIFSMDGGPGLSIFLKSQSRLRVLNCSHIFKLSQDIDVWILMSNVFECIARNANTLVDVKIYPIFIIDSPRQKLLHDNVLGMFAINCKVFSECVALKTLILGLHSYKKEEDLANSGLSTLMGTRLTNMQLIPTHIVEVCLPVEEYSRDELELFANNFPLFTKLKSLYFGTSQLNPLNAYLVKMVWIQNLIGLPEIERAEFHNGRLEDEGGTRKLLQDAKVAVKMTHNFPRYTFEIERGSSVRDA